MRLSNIYFRLGVLYSRIKFRKMFGIDYLKLYQRGKILRKRIDDNYVFDKETLQYTRKKVIEE